MIQTFGKYQILEHIATGTMAEIYKARQEGIGGFQRTYAIKRILPELSQNQDYIAMLVDEAKVAGLLSHANIVQIVDLGNVDGIWYIAMEYVQGRDLGAVLRRAAERGLNLPIQHTAFIAIELLKGLEYAHQRQVMRGGRPVALNIIHRDVSPPNILLSFQGEVKLTDFGIARASLKALETGSGITRGRFEYMSPEQVTGSRDLDQRSDLFSVGVLLYEMLTGHHPFRADHDAATIERVRDGRYTPIHHHNPDIPFPLETIVDRALQSNRENRFPNATAFKEALDRFFHDSGFIFTHATLASYVRQLFPEGSVRNARAPDAGASTAGANAAAENDGDPQTVLMPKAHAEPPERPTATTSVVPGAKAKRPVIRRSLPPGARVDPATAEHDVELVARNAGQATEPVDRGAVPPVTPRGAVPDPSQKPVPRPATPAPRGASPPAAPPAPGAVPPRVTRVTRGMGSTFGEPSPQDGSLARATPIGKPLEDGEHATVIRPRSGENKTPSRKPTSKRPTEDDDATRHIDPGGKDESATVIRKSAAVDEVPAESPSGNNVVRRVSTNPGKRRRADPWLPLAAGVFGTFLGVGLTLAVFPVVTDLDGQLHRWGIHLVPIPTERMPHVEIVAPKDAQILLDDEAVGRTMTLEPFVPHKLTVTLRGLEPWTRELQLGLDESRVFVVSPIHAREQQAKRP